MRLFCPIAFISLASILPTNWVADVRIWRGRRREGGERERERERKKERKEKKKER
jgi:hypothetical protein